MCGCDEPPRAPRQLQQDGPLQFQRVKKEDDAPGVRIVGRLYDGEQPREELNSLPDWAKSEKVGFKEVSANEQIRQLEQFLKDGVLNQAEFDDARDRILASAPKPEEMQRGDGNDETNGKDQGDGDDNDDDDDDEKKAKGDQKRQSVDQDREEDHDSVSVAAVSIAAHHPGSDVPSEAEGGSSRFDDISYEDEDEDEDGVEQRVNDEDEEGDEQQENDEDDDDGDEEEG